MTQRVWHLNYEEIQYRLFYLGDDIACKVLVSVIYSDTNDVTSLLNLGKGLGP